MPFLNVRLQGGRPAGCMAQPSLRLLLKEVMILLLLQLSVILLNFPVGFFHVVIHELVHDWHLIKEES